jgi:hypothetical protein
MRLDAPVPDGRVNEHVASNDDFGLIVSHGVSLPARTMINAARASPAHIESACLARRRAGKSG